MTLPLLLNFPQPLLIKLALLACGTARLTDSMAGDDTDDPGQFDASWGGLAASLLGIQLPEVPIPRPDQDMLEEEQPPAQAVVPSQLPKVALPDEIIEHLLAKDQSPHLGTEAFKHVFADLMPHLALPQEPSTTEKEVQKLGLFYLRRACVLHCSKSVFSKLLHLELKTIDGGITSLASSLLHHDHCLRQAMEENVTKTGLTLLLYIDLAKYDETPMKLRQREALDPLVPETGPGGPSSSADPIAGSVTAADLQGHYHGRTTSVSKLFATESKYLMLLKREVPVDAPEAPPQYTCISGSALTCLQILADTTGQTIHHALQSNSSMSAFANNFQVKVRAATTDLYPANLLAEKYVMCSRSAEWCHLHHPCNVHLVARSFSKSFDLLSEHIQGLLHLSLALSTGSTMGRFRKSLTEVVSSRLQVIRGHCPAEAEEHRLAMLDLFCQTGSNLALKQYLLQRLPNGDWRDQDHVQVYIPPGADCDESLLKAHVTTALLICLAGKVFRVYPRHRWLGCDVATDEIGLMECVHGLASKTWHHYITHGGAGVVTSSGQSSASQTAATAPDEAAAIGAMIPPSAESSVGRTLAISSAATDHLQPEALAATDIAGEAGAGSASETWAAQNERHRKVAGHWLASNPLGYIIGLRTCMRPLCKLLSAYITRSGHAWEQAQRQSVATAQEGGEEGWRTSSLMEYLRLTDEQEFFADLAKLRDPSTWKHVPPSSRTLRFQSQLFRVIGRMGSAIHELLVRPTQKCPWKVFSVFTEGDEAWQALQELPECMRDKLATEMLKLSPDTTQPSPDVLACLRALSLTVTTETVGLEWGHGRVHRLISTAAVHTWTPSLEFIAAQWLLQKHRLRSSRTWSGALEQQQQQQQMTTPKPQTEGEEPAPKRRRQGGGGGAWRAFISLVTRGQQSSPDLHALATRFHEEEQQNSALYQQAVAVGQSATARRKEQGTLGFGPKTRQYMRQRRTEASLCRSLDSLLATPSDATFLAQPSQAKKETVVTDLTQEIKEVRGQELLRRRRQRAEASLSLEKYIAHCQQQQPLALEHCTDLLSSMEPQQVNSLCYVPSQSFTFFEVMPDVTDLTVRTAAWSRAHSRQSNLDLALKTDWRRRHASIDETSEPPAVPEHVKAPTPCLQHGFCICSEEGKRIFSLRNRFLRSLKDSFKSKDVDQKELLQAGFVVLQLLEERREESFGGFGSLAAALGLDEDLENVAQTLRGPCWLHIGLQYFKPYRPTFQLLESLSEQPGGRVLLQQTGKYYNEFALWSALDLSSTWTVHYYTLLETAAPLAAVNAGQCIVQRWSTEATTLWPLPRAPRRRRVSSTGRRTSSRNTSAERQGPSDAGPTGAGETLPPEPDTMPEPGDERDEGLQDSEAEEGEDSGDDISVDDEVFELLFGDMQDTAVMQGEEAAEALEAPLQASVDPDTPPLDEVLQTAEAMERAEELVQAEAAADADAPVEGPVAAGEPVAPQPAAAAADGAETEEEPEQAVLRRERAELVVPLPGGKITFYPKKQIFVATCNNVAHGSCVLTRSSLAGRRRSQGRPLGLLSSWLFLGETLATKADHWDRGNWPNQDLRSYHRELLADRPGGPELLAEERAVEPGEGAEPDFIP